MAEARVARALGRADLVLLKVVAIVNINNVPPAAVHGRASLLLWALAFVLFFVPEAIAVLAFARRYPGEGGVYLWIREAFGPGHGFLAGWCYWTNNLFYIPVLLVYMAGTMAYAGGSATAALVERPLFTGGVALAWLALITALNVRGLGAGKWVQNAGGIGTALAVALVLLAGGAAWHAGTAQPAPWVAQGGVGMLATFSVMCNALVGIELASTMGDEIRDPARDLRPAIVTAGALALGAYLLVTLAVLALVPVGAAGIIQGIMQALAAGAAQAGVPWLVAPVALLLALSVGGAASAWFAGSSRVPFVAGVSRALPAALGRVHPRWGSPHVALRTCAALVATFTVASLAGSTVAEAYQVLLKAAVVIQLLPFGYLFLGLARLEGTAWWQRGAGGVGLATTLLGIAFAFVPPADVADVARFEGKLVAGVLLPTAVGLWLYRRARLDRAAPAGLA